jgi:hypothetical protein
MTDIRFCCAVIVALLTVFATSALPNLKASAGCQSGRVVITNSDSAHWFEVKIEVNGAYVHQTAVIAKGDTMRFFPSVFTKSDGSRLDLGTTACKTIDIHATVNSKRDHWNGAYK